MGRWLLWIFCAIGLPGWVAFGVYSARRNLNLAACPHCEKDISTYVVKWLFSTALAALVIYAFYDFAWNIWFGIVTDVPWRV